MIELSHQQIQSFDFVMSLKKVANCPKLTYKVMYWSKKVIEKIEAESKVSQETRQGVLKKYAELNEDGSFKLKEGTMGEAVIAEEKKPLFDQEIKDFMLSKISLGLDKIAISEKEVESAELTPIDMLSLDSVFEFPEPKAPEAPALEAVK